MSLEKDNILADIYLTKDWTPLNYIAWSLLRLEYLFGGFGTIFAKGDKACVSLNNKD